ncbi:MAG: tetratricopeptide (TPR) repeat protein, partial [Planctomycetaceae bacterium]
EFRRLYAECLAEKGGIQSLTDAIDLMPEQSRYYEARGALLLGEGRVEEAVADFETALQGIPDSEFGNRIGVTARGLVSTGRFTEAIALSGLAHEHGAVSYLLDVALCEAKLGLHEYEGALSHIDNAMKIYPRNPSWMIKRRAEAKFYLGRFDDALADLQNALEVGPDDLSALTWISVDDVANCPDETFRLGMLALADRTVELNDGSPPSRVARAILLAAFSDWERASEDLDAIVDSEDGTYYDLYQAALLSITAHDVARYKAVSAGMLEDSADWEKPIEMHFAVWTSALAADAVDDYAPAIKLARQSVDMEPGNQQYLTGLGAILMRSGQYAEARSEIENALAANKSGSASPNFARYFLAMTQYHLGQQKTGQDLLKTANRSADAELAESPIWNRRLTLELLRQEAETLIGKAESSEQ